MLAPVGCIKTKTCNHWSKRLKSAKNNFTIMQYLKKDLIEQEGYSVQEDFNCKKID
jgi:hypothetical protein